MLYRLRAEGISLGEVFPEGIEVAMDLEPMNYSHANDKKAIAPIPAVEKFVILRRTEKAEPLESLRRKPEDGYDAHDKTKAENFDVLIEVAAEEGYIRKDDVERLKKFRDNPNDECWMVK